MGEQQSIAIDVVSDVVCPWCYIGLKRLEAASREVPEIALDIHWRPYQLDPSIPPEGHDRRAYMAAKFGSEERLKQAYENVVAAGRSAGIEFNLEAIEVSPNTLDAHRLIRWAASAGDNLQDALVRRLFSLYFEQGANVGDHAVLIGAAADAGMDAALVETLLATDADRDAVLKEIDTARRMGVTGVPSFLLDQRYVVVGAQDPATLADAFRKVAAARAGAEGDVSTG